MPNDMEALDEGVRFERAGLLDRALATYRSIAETSVDPDGVAAALTHEADVHRSLCDWDASLQAARKAKEVAKAAGLGSRVSDAMIAEVNVQMSRGDFGAATMLLHEVASSIDPRIRGIALQNLGTILAQTGQLEAAERAFIESVVNFREAGYARGEAIALNNFGRLALDAGDPQRAKPLLDDALRLGRQLEDLELAAMASLNLASALCANGEFSRAQDLLMSALGYFTMTKNTWREIECLRLAGEINEKCDDCGNAIRCYDLALRRATEIGAAVEQKAVQERLVLLGHGLDGSQSGIEGVA
jgi:tetratricopeptide (TPR) repeat protein